MSMPQRIDDILLNLSEEYVQRSISSFSLEDLRKGIYEVVSIYILRNNLYSSILKENKSLEKSLEQTLYIKKNRLVFEVDRLIEETMANAAQQEKIEFNDRILKLAKAALAEFLIYITRQTVASKNMMAEAEALLDRYTIVGTDIVRFHLHGTEYQVQLTPYQAKTITSDTNLKNKLLLQLKFRLEKIQRKINNFINSQSADALGNYFRKQIEKIVAPTLQRTTNMLTEVTANSSNFNELNVARLANQVEHLELEASGLQKMLDQIKPTDLETIRLLALDLDDPEELLRQLDGTPAGQQLSEIIKDNLAKLKDKSGETRLNAQNFFSKLKNQIELTTNEKSATASEIEEHILSEKENELNFQQKDIKQTINNPDIQLYSRKKSQRNTKQNWFSGWLSNRNRNKNSHINLKVGIPPTKEMLQLLKKDEAANVKPKYTNTII